MGTIAVPPTETSMLLTSSLSVCAWATVVNKAAKARRNATERPDLPAWVGGEVPRQGREPRKRWCEDRAGRQPDRTARRSALGARRSALGARRSALYASRERQCQAFFHAVGIVPLPNEKASGAALLRRRPRRLLRAARQELLDPSKAWWGGRRGRLADRRCCPISVSLGVVPLVLARFVEVPVRIEVAAGS